MTKEPRYPNFFKSTVIVQNREKCTGCGICELMCSLRHEKKVNPRLARGVLLRDPFEADYIFKVCRQCLAPSCYVACPEKDKALRIDPETGVKYIVADECLGCKKCSKACPVEPRAIKFDREKKISFKCDLCRGRINGPICVEYCPQEALSIIPARKKGRKNE